MPVYFRPIELAEYCFLSEAVEFLALGRPPERQQSYYPPMDREGNYIFDVDARFYWRDMPDNFEPSSQYAYEYFDQDEFELCGIDAPTNYFETAESFHFGEISDAIMSIETTKNPFLADIGSEVRAEMEERAALARKFLERSKGEIREFHETNAKFKRFIEAAWAKLFEAIQRELVEVEAINFDSWENLANDGEYERAAQFEKLAPEAIKIGHDYTQNTLEFGSKNFVATRVKTDPIEKLFETCISMQKIGTARRIGQTIISATGDQRSRPKRGASEAVDWEQVREHIVKLAQADQLPRKKEACIQLAIEFCQRKFARRVGRSTVQSQLKPLLQSLRYQ